MKTAETMTTERIKEIQQTTAYPDSVSVKQALLQVWNECEQSANAKAKALLEEAAEKATIWVETPINGTEFDFVERDLSEACASINHPPFIEKISVFKESILSLILKEQ